ncbi:hypothetical protein TSMEX_008713 [Taenia solium]|eukprot:TsM_000369200 transcript=TsM_000369200 gene=TsM_000369200
MARARLHRCLSTCLSYWMKSFCTGPRTTHTPAIALETTKFLSRLCDRERVDFMINAECHKLADIWKTSEFRVAAANYVQHCMDDFL